MKTANDRRRLLPAKNTPGIGCRKTRSESYKNGKLPVELRVRQKYTGILREYTEIRGSLAGVSVLFV